MPDEKNGKWYKKPWPYIGVAFLAVIVLQIVVAIQLSECNREISTPAVWAAILFGISAIPNGIWVYDRTNTGTSNKSALGSWIGCMIVGSLQLGIIYGQQILTNHKDYDIKCNDSTDKVPAVYPYVYVSGVLLAGILVISHVLPKDSETSSNQTNTNGEEEETTPLKW